MRCLGIDIGTTNIKAVELSGSGSEVALENYGVLETFSYLERPNAAIQSNYFKIVEEATTDLLNKLFLTFKPRTKKAILSLPTFSSFITVFEIPFQDQKEIERAIPFEAKKYIPIPLEDLEIDWAVISSSQNEKILKSQILLIAVPKELIARYKKIAKAVNLDVVALELESVALTRALVGQDKSPFLIMDIGSQSSNLSVIDNGYLVSNENLTIAGAEISHTLAKGLGVSQERAEEFKRVKGFNVDQSEAEVVNMMLPIVDYFGNEITRAINIYNGKTNKQIKRVILAGGTANLPGLDGYLSQTLGLNIEKAWPFGKIKYQPFLEPLLKEIGPSLSISVGLAMRGMY